MTGWSWWVEKVAAVEGATTFALFRIGIGLCTLLTVGSVAWRGLVPVLWVDVAHGGYRTLGHGPWLIAWLGGPTSQVIGVLTAGALLGGLLVAVGLGGRISALLALICSINVLSVNGHAGGSYDDLLTNAQWLVVLGGGTQTLSVDARLFSGRWAPASALTPAFVRWLALWQLVLMYCTTGLQKVSAYWVPGGDASALYYILQQPEWHRRDMSFLAYVYPLTQVATTVTWLWEVSAPVWIVAVWFSLDPTRPGRVRAWSNRVGLRWIYAAIGLAMHLAIWITMEVGPFSPLSLAYYVTIVHPWEWERLWAWLRSKAEREPVPAAS
jgi:hypothetical protein